MYPEENDVEYQIFGMDLPVDEHYVGSALLLLGFIVVLLAIFGFLRIAQYYHLKNLRKKSGDRITAIEELQEEQLCDRCTSCFDRYKLVSIGVSSKKEASNSRQRSRDY